MVGKMTCWLKGGICEKGQTGGLLGTDLSVCKKRCSVPADAGIDIDLTISHSDSIYRFSVRDGKVEGCKYGKLENGKEKT